MKHPALSSAMSRAPSPATSTGSGASWRQDGDYALVHPDGWSIARYRIDGVWTYMLWHGNETQGRFATADAAKRRHAELTGATATAHAREGPL